MMADGDDDNYDPATYEADPRRIMDDARRIADWRRKAIDAILNRLLKSTADRSGTRPRRAPAARASTANAPSSSTSGNAFRTSWLTR